MGLVGQAAIRNPGQVACKESIIHVQLIELTILPVITGRVPFQKIAENIVKAHLDRQFEIALEQALRSAR